VQREEHVHEDQALSMHLVGGQTCMGWDDPNFVDGMVHIDVILVLFGSKDLSDGMKYDYLVIFNIS
jgi:hypothetical protein